MLEHGGNLLTAAHHYGIPLAAWLDLSTGINSRNYPVPDIPPDLWQRLPEDGDGLIDAATTYYGSQHLLPAAGTQAILQALPHLRPASRVAIPAPTYAEHPKAWETAGHAVTRCAPDNVAAMVATHDVLLLCNPNNPTGQLYRRDQLLAWHADLAARGGWLVVDEAFLDATPEHSLAPEIGLPGLIVLRSLGKFFGLAGARVGFVLAWPALLDSLQDMLGPWAIGGPARLVAMHALADEVWQQETRQRLRQDSMRLANMLDQHGLTPSGGTDLFQWRLTPRAAEIHELLARQGIWTRLFREPTSLRFGLPATEGQWQRLDAALAASG